MLKDIRSAAYWREAKEIVEALRAKDRQHNREAWIARTATPKASPNSKRARMHGDLNLRMDLAGCLEHLPTSSMACLQPAVATATCCACSVRNIVSRHEIHNGCC